MLKEEKDEVETSGSRSSAASSAEDNSDALVTRALVRRRAPSRSIRLIFALEPKLPGFALISAPRP